MNSAIKFSVCAVLALTTSFFLESMQPPHTPPRQRVAPHEMRAHRAAMGHYAPLKPGMRPSFKMAFDLLYPKSVNDLIELIDEYFAPNGNGFTDVEEAEEFMQALRELLDHCNRQTMRQARDSREVVSAFMTGQEARIALIFEGLGAMYRRTLRSYDYIDPYGRA